MCPEVKADQPCPGRAITTTDTRTDCVCGSCGQIVLKQMEEAGEALAVEEACCERPEDNQAIAHPIINTQ
ncbi:hypothetical protein O1611_g8918 [Lasiodiplodia mahajangana]|uniref:Uncharacterized protein n=1 Tax=Lasiodiplodia mahajangana TaxID=1108764 RepID=A0ACC2JC19_9PEZI|nr:hypothetical protein O1611_g8918 [Lasiodiplodia mahajangana]